VQRKDEIVAGLIGVLARAADAFVPKDPEQWVFGALEGTRFADNSKYFFLYAHARRQGANVCWLTRNREVLDRMRAAGLPCEHNYSWRGIWRVLRAGVLFTSTRRADVMFFYRRDGRRVIHLHHGMPIKKIWNDYEGAVPLSKNRVFLDALWTYFVAGFRWSDVDAVVSTSPFYQQILRGAFGTEQVFVTGQPRNDILACSSVPPHLRSSHLPPAAQKRAYGLDDRYVVTYMPTHRKFGRGQQAPIPFANDRAAQRRLIEAGIQIAVKAHPNSVRDLRSVLERTEPGLYVDLSTRCEDPQQLLLVSDCLVTDYSSCFIDFLLCDRPIVFYLFDEEDYIRTDGGVYFRMEEHQAGPIARDEGELMRELLRCSAGEDGFRDKRGAISERFNSYRDDQSSRRVWELASELLANRPAGQS